MKPVRVICVAMFVAALVFARCKSGEQPESKPAPPPSGPKAIPVLRVTTGQGRPISKETYMPATMIIEDPDKGYAMLASEEVKTEIRGRGNTTWDMPKKPYKLKLNQKKRLLGMSNNKHWALMANYSDKSLLRNALAFKLSEIVGMSWAPRWVPVELYIDNLFLGQYMLTETVRADDERVEVDIIQPGENSGTALTGGYLFTIDDKDLDPNWGTPKVGFWHVNASGSQFPVVFEEPEDPTAAQQEYARALFKEVEDAIYNRSFTEYSKIIDVESVVQFFIVNELAKNPDGNMRLSTFMAKPRGGKLYFPCVWDFDISFGNCDFDWAGGMWNPSVGWQIRDAVFIRQFLRNKEFCDLVLRRWNEWKPELKVLESYLRMWAAEIDDAQKRNFQTWPILGRHVWPNWNAASRTTYKAEVDFLVDFINKRVEWMDRELNAGNHRL